MDNSKIIKTILSDSPSSIYDEATSYKSKSDNIDDNYGLSRKLKTSYSDYLALVKGQKRLYDSVVKVQNVDLNTTNSKNNMSEDLSQDEAVNSFADGISVAQAKETIKLYFSLYMGKLNSDMQWRLGAATDTVKDIDDAYLIDGKFPSRGFVIPISKENIFNGKKFIKSDINFVSYGFPPYKLDINKNIIDNTSLMKKDSNATFDLDNFLIDREEFTYREMGMKSLSDYINYLQYLIEGSTGIVSTYLTEWDLSTYMQENLISMADNKVDITLNYRIRQDNPFSDRPEYRGDKALSFNACGSSVSKLYQDNEKLWLPSDYVYSSWWTPYLEGIDFTLSTLDLPEYNISISYLKCYDDFDFLYDYDSQKNLIDVVKHQDILYSMASCKTSFTSRYYDIFYSTPEDSMSGYDILFDQYLKEASGSSDCRTMQSLVQDAKIEMLCGGGYGNALYSSSYGYGGMYGKQSIKKALERKGQLAKSELLNQNSQLSSSEIELSSVGLVDDIANSKNCNGSTLSKMDGISRLSPPLYGGIHGACYSLNSLRGHLSKTILNLNIPAVNANQSGNFSDLEDRYTNPESPHICRSPTLNKNTLLKGDIKYCLTTAVVLTAHTIEFEAEVTHKPFVGFVFKFPEKKNGSNITYSGDVYTKRKTVCVIKPLSIGLNIYRSIFNRKSSLVRDRFSPIKTYSTIEVPCRMGTYYTAKYSIAKVPIINDDPNLEWAIYLHKFDDFKADTKIESSSFIREISVASKTRFKSDKLTKTAMSQNPGFILRFPGHPEKEQEVIRNMLWYGKGANNSNPISLYFLEGNKNKRFYEGPESIFKAPCYVKYYKLPWRESLITRVLRVLLSLLRIKLPSKKEESTPYIYVDLYNAEKFYDGLNQNLNVVPQSGNKPLHTNSKCNFTTAGSQFTNPMQKIHALPLDVITPKNGARSESNAGIEGIGLLTGILGQESKSKIVFNLGAGFFKIDNGLDLYYDKDTPLKDLPFCTAHVEQPTSVYDSSSKTMTSLSAYQKYVKRPYDVGLRNAYVNLLTRITMFKHEDEYFSPYFLDISAPYNNILSALISHKNYLNSISDLLDSLGPEYIHNLLVYNVDRSVLYACCMTFKENVFYNVRKAYKTHVLYNYWIDKAIRLFGSSATAKKSLKEVIDQSRKFISLADGYIDNMSKILEKDSKTWTLNDIDNLNKYILGIKETFYKRNVIDDFMMSYIHILYYYRLFYIGNRFNKVDGTMWRMRQFEASLSLLKKPNVISPKSPSEFQINPERHSVAFYEIQNTTKMKTESVAKNIVLDKDRIYRIYVKVNYTTKEAFDKWCAYKENPNGERVPEVDRYLVDGEYKYVLKPSDGIYQFRSKEYNDNEKNIDWNARHINDIKKPVWTNNVDCTFNIQWHNSEDKTPIRWNVLGNIDANNLLEYAPMGITGEDLVCLIEEGSDFWTINIPKNLWPEKDHYKKNLYIKQIISTNDDIQKDAYVSILGPFAHSISPIIEDPIDVSLSFMDN